PGQNGSASTQAGVSSAGSASQGLLGAPQAYPGAAQGPGASILQSGNPQAALSDFLGSLGLQAAGGAQQAQPSNQTIPQAPLLVSSPHAEEGMRDALRLLMDGRLMWQGQFTEGVPMRFERSDAWRANRRSTGGMEKGSSIRISLELPSLGRVEVSGLGFGGQVSLRVQAEDPATSTMVKALPQLQAKLRERGLAGTQVVIESL
ncbi:MAG: flagellar hook-length control protein FliK, partial [Actinobacteria bacterium]|nr:flagellar hook-length control protein FliK [Actinomycetota bacterium]